MPLEAASLIHQLDPAAPAHDDSLGQMDAHLRLIKAAIRATFPNLTGAVTSTQAQLDVALTAAVRLAALEAASNKLTGDQSLNGNLTTAPGKSLNAGFLLENGTRLVPPGTIVLWFGQLDAIPAGWVLCNGQNATPDLRDRFVVGAGSAYAKGATGGNTGTIATSSTAGAHSHGGQVSENGAHGHGADTGIGGQHTHAAAVQGHTLTIAEMPSHTHSYRMDDISATSLGAGGAGAGNGYANVDTLSQGGNAAHGHGISIGYGGEHTHGVVVYPVGHHSHTIGLDGGHSHTIAFDNRPLYYALAYIMRQ